MSRDDRKYYWQLVETIRRTIVSELELLRSFIARFERTSSALLLLGFRSAKNHQSPYTIAEIEIAGAAQRKDLGFGISRDDVHFSDSAIWAGSNANAAHLPAELVVFSEIMTVNCAALVTP